MRFDVLLTTVRMRLCLLTNGRQDENPHAEQMRLEWKEGCYVRVVGQVKLQGLAVFLKIKTVFTVSKGTILPQGLLYSVIWTCDLVSVLRVRSSSSKI